jgi:hypothetical protein
MKSGIDRADRDLENLGYPVERDVNVVVEDQHGPVIHRQPADRGLQLVTKHDGIETVGCHRLVSRQHPQVR